MKVSKGCNFRESTNGPSFKALLMEELNEWFPKELMDFWLYF